MRTSDDTTPELRADDPSVLRERPVPESPALPRTGTRSHTADDPSTAGGEHPAVSLRQVSKVFGGHRAVDAVDLEIRQNEFFAMLGPSGCGKTTTLKMIGGFEQPTSGVVEIAGRDATGEPPFRRDVNTVFQSYALFPHLNVRDNVAFGLRMKKVSRRERARTADEVLERVGLRGYGSRPVPGLSGGEQQRIAVARALVNRPSVLLLDEPLGALDLKLRKSMQTELKQIQHEAGIAFVYVTHDQSEALTMADRIAVMSGGRVAQVGDPVAIYERPATRFVADFIGESSFLDGEVRETEGTQLVVETGGGVTLRAVGAGIGRGDRVALAIRPEKVEIQPQSGDGASSDAINRLPGVVTARTYGGSDTVYDLHTPAGAISARVAMDPARGHDAGTFEIGDRVLATFAVTSTVAVPSETPAADVAATTNDNEA